MRVPGKIEVSHLFPELYSELIKLLEKFSIDKWNAPTSSTKWTVKDIVAHLIDTDLRRLSLQRDNFIPMIESRQIGNDQELLEYINCLNNSWTEVAGRLSPAILIDLLKYISIEIPKLMQTLDMDGDALFGVSWAGESKSKCWFDIAREYTEKWYHQQQIREAVGEKLLTEEKWLYPLIDTFVRGLPNIYQNRFPGNTNSTVFIYIYDLPEGNWVLKNSNCWELYAGETSNYNSKVIMNADTAWRMFSKNISKEEAKGKITLEGDIELGELIRELTTFIK